LFEGPHWANCLQQLHSFAQLLRIHVDNPYAVNFVTQLLPMYQTFNAELKAAVEN